jgi:hypothetical protein
MLGAALLMLGENPRAEDVRDIDLRRLFEPPEAEREEETTGRISIYDGLRDIDVERAMRDES